MFVVRCRFFLYEKPNDADLKEFTQQIKKKGSLVAGKLLDLAAIFFAAAEALGLTCGKSIRGGDPHTHDELINHPY